ncbi:MAG: chemotaxis protein CheR, partial [Treponema sp.]|nr:chemotaxis protein CheR [Treponema sp.]
LRLLKYDTFSQYIDFVFSDEGLQSELYHMIDAVTTNKTDFFREADHFDFLLNHWLVKQGSRYNAATPCRIWSAGCASGEEVYTLMIVMEEFKRQHPDFFYSIIGTDISLKVLHEAVDAVYEEDKIANLPIEYKKRYFLKSKYPARRAVRVKPEFRNKVRFERLNLMDKEYPFRQAFDIIFCRNVIIYFDRKTKEQLVYHLVSHLKSEGLLILGHSESMTGLNLPLSLVAPTVYCKNKELI